MGHVTHQPTSITGYGRVTLKTGETYVGRASYDGRAVTGSMSLRVIVNGVVEYRPPKRRLIPLHAVRELWWDDDASATYPASCGPASAARSSRRRQARRHDVR